MVRDDTEDAVFEQALAAALEHLDVPGDRRLERVARIAKPSILAAARAQADNYVHHSSSVRVKRSELVARRPVLWRWIYVVVIPSITWAAVVLTVPLNIRPAQDLYIGPALLIPAGISLVVLAMSNIGGVGRFWALGGLWATIYVMLTVAVAHGWPSWVTWPALIACAVLAAVSRDAVETVLPSSDTKRKIRAADLALAQWQESVLTEGVLPVLRAEINSAHVVRGAELAFSDEDGLLSGTSLHSHQEIPAGRELAGLVAALAGGSFALAGPRGAGKTNLLRAFCRGAYREPNQPLDVSILVAAPVDYVPREFVLHLYQCSCQAVLDRIREVKPQAIRQAERRDRWWRAQPGALAQLARSAYAGLTNIAYIRTSSGETSGKFGFRGAEISLKRGISLAGRPATYPEVVDDFRQFVAAAAEVLEPSRVVIAIDEIDRIGAGEPARRFLNEIKAIFDVPGCYYLVSVSTEAQHDFELAGMGLRSVFDSSFDEIVRVDYLDFDLSRRLIGRSVVGLPEQFAALAFAFSGGLARQLIRSARAIVRQPLGTRLEVVAANLVNDELDRVGKTTGDALTALEDHNGVTALLRVLADPPDDLRDYRKAVQAAYDGEDTAIRDLRDLAAARIEFLAVVRDYFTDDLTEVVPAQVDALARARRYAGTNPATGLALLEEFSVAASARPAPEPPPR